MSARQQKLPGSLQPPATASTGSGDQENYDSHELPEKSEKGPAASRCSQSAVNQGKSEDPLHKRRGGIPSPQQHSADTSGDACYRSLQSEKIKAAKTFFIHRAVPALSPTQPKKFRPCVNLWGGHRACLSLRHPWGAAAVAHPGQGWAEPGSTGEPPRQGRGLRRTSHNSRAATSPLRPDPKRRRAAPRRLLCTAALAEALQRGVAPRQPGQPPALPPAGPAPLTDAPRPLSRRRRVPARGPPAPPHLCRRSPRSEPGPGPPLPAGRGRCGAGPAARARLRARPRRAGGAARTRYCRRPRLPAPPPPRAGAAFGFMATPGRGDPGGGTAPLRATPALPGWGREQRRPPASLGTAAPGPAAGEGSPAAHPHPPAAPGSARRPAASRTPGEVR
ncbi:sterile alpha motif domain-containing protein 1-like [Vidua chalybeata]|uniref:sterile alpha motif domain-containing protein 1-like n=1 Tax=Vidua chalybeata TaxID=81927 RepID=UPI0023A8AB0A|nr:sterile alpha motif domain-containing protein 1-like [Vidua chalybeata]